MNFGLPCNWCHNLHRFGMRAVAADDLDFPIVAHDDPVPVEQHVMCQRFGETFVEAHHHFGDAVLGRVDIACRRAQAELLTQRTLDALAPQDFAFNFRGFDRFLADKLDFEHVPVILADMLESAQKLAGFDEKLGFRRPLRRFESKVNLGQSGFSQFQVMSYRNLLYSSE